MIQQYPLNSSHKSWGKAQIQAATKAGASIDTSSFQRDVGTWFPSWDELEGEGGRMTHWLRGIHGGLQIKSWALR